MSDYDEHCVSLYAICGMWYASVLMVANHRGLWNLRNARGGWEWIDPGIKGLVCEEQGNLLWNEAQKSCLRLL